MALGVFSIPIRLEGDTDSSPKSKPPQPESRHNLSISLSFAKDYGTLSYPFEGPGGGQTFKIQFPLGSLMGSKVTDRPHQKVGYSAHAEYRARLAD
jgi:hypothetical protein